MSWLGLDIGGANIKAANAAGWARSVPFALWRDPHGLATALAALLNSAPAADRLAVTMTGELCDCFSTKREGVRHILSAVEGVADGRGTSVYLSDGRFVTLAAARDLSHLASASNWRALAQFACRFVPSGSGLLIDIGSTTSDIIPIVDGRVAARGRTDTERLVARELVYSGIGRTPICAVAQALPLGAGMCPVAAEIFSTTADAHILLGQMAADPSATWTADGRPLTFACSRQRLARQICADATDVSTGDYRRMAQAVFDLQLAQLSNGIATVVHTLPKKATIAVLSGAGEFLARAAVESVLPECRIASLAEYLGPESSACAAALAVAVLAKESAGMDLV
jgi:probable H4MPT-linked C1 transfer pathway protein